MGDQVMLHFAWVRQIPNADLDAWAALERKQTQIEPAAVEAKECPAQSAT